MEDYIVSWVISGVLFWTTTFLLVRNVFRDRSFDFCNRVVSIVHAAVAVGLASLSVQHWGCPVCPLASRSSAVQMKALAVTLSYLIYDLICCLFDKIPRMDNSVHHIVGIVGITAGLAYGMCGSEMVAAMWLTEISSPFLHMRELLKELGYRDTNLTLAFDILFAAIFSLARMVGGPYLTYVTLTADYPLLIKAMALGLQLVSAFWFYKILRMVRYKVAKRMAPNKSIKISVH
ncbi:Protein LATERAL ORGAN [Musa troglodytarum]|uniref:Protein LATERAL ORGAN n=1 Tax=Musa troglodytarum TaxID=320322 RepID=A0A9E7LD44_9LILI|nr:Protein LATERAL ORGAN [Musa troglodytarum]URE46325.1 Protein LATERAL ORGAN [Musa troglodytarum]